MPKSDSPPLLAPGMHHLTLSQLHSLAVKPFHADVQRAQLFQKFDVWVNAMRGHGVKGTLWLDGSFLTEKVGPGDIDCVLWNPYWHDPNTVDQRAQVEVERLTDHATAEALYGLDFYLEAPDAQEMFHREAYWRGILGFCHDRVTAKGFAEITL